MSNSNSLLLSFVLYVYFVGLVPVLLGILKYKYLNLVSNYVWILTCVSFSFDVILRILTYNGLPNLFIAYFYVIFEFLIITLVYRLEFKVFLPKYLLEGIFFIFIIFTFLDISLLKGLSSFNSYQRFVECILVIAYVSIYFYKLAKELKTSNLMKEPLFWFSVGLLLYFSGSIFIFIFSNYLLTYSNEFALMFWGVHGGFLILLHLFNAIAIWVGSKKLKVST